MMNKKMTILAGLVSLISTVALAEALPVGATAPDLVLKQINAAGESVQTSVTARDGAAEYVFIEFFATTCGWCHKNLPNIHALSVEFKDKMTTRLIGIDRSEQALLDYRTQNQALITYDYALDTARDAKRAFGINATPTQFLIKDQKIIWQYIGYMDEAVMTEFRALVK
jgi:hypothetical protein